MQILYLKQFFLFHFNSSLTIESEMKGNCWDSFSHYISSETKRVLVYKSPCSYIF